MRSILETKRDMEGTRPMDRLICGDVGFGKTEVAIRAVFKCRAGRPAGRVPRAHDHPGRAALEEPARTLRRLPGPRRLHEPPPVTQAASATTLEGLLDGSVDVVIGTHRILSKDVRFKNLGLVVVDEEQRFGVRQKEKFKQLFRLVDVLTLSATPIPRTLYLSLTGARDMSTIETAPPNRHPVETVGRAL